MEESGVQHPSSVVVPMITKVVLWTPSGQALVRQIGFGGLDVGKKAMQKKMDKMSAPAKKGQKGC